MELIVSILTTIVIYSLLNQSYNLVLGYAGQFHLGQIAFFGLGAYGYGIATVNYDINPFIAMLIGGIVALIAGLLLGKLCLSFKGHYLVIVSYGFSEIIKAFELNLTDLTNGPRGLIGIPRPEIMGLTFYDSISFLIFAFVITALCQFIMYRIIKSPYGLLLEAMREDEIAASTIGKNTVNIKTHIMMVSAFFAGIAGTLFVMYLSIAVPEDFGLHNIILILLMVILGGRGSFMGPIVGTIIITLIFESLRFVDLPDSMIGTLRLLIYSTLFILIMIFKPEGVIGRKNKMVEITSDR